ncbi:MAG TPA: hypothetical protein VKS22_13290 [Candidatus Binataceae bacterium]|nr:hypothetical protein [Candidatus Binataceae bacterium]
MQDATTPVRFAAGSGGGGVNLPATSTVGNAVLVDVVLNISTGVASVSGQGASWVTVYDSGSAYNSHIYQFCGKVVTPGTAATVAYSGGGAALASMHEVSDAALCRVDTTYTSRVNAAAALTLGPTHGGIYLGVPTRNPADLVEAIASHNVGGEAVTLPGAPWTAFHGYHLATIDRTYDSVYQIVSATGRFAPAFSWVTATAHAEGGFIALLSDDSPALPAPPIVTQNIGPWQVGQPGDTTTCQLGFLQPGAVGCLIRINGRVLWSGCNPNTYNWGQLDTIIGNMVAAGIKGALDIQLGGQSAPDCELTRLAGISGAIYTTKYAFGGNPTQFGTPIVACDNIQYIIPWNSTWIADAAQVIRDIKARIVLDGGAAAILRVNNTGEVLNDDETRLPRDGTVADTFTCSGYGAQCVSACGADPCSCAAPNDAAALIAAPYFYTPNTAIGAINALDTAYYAAWPGVPIAHMLLPTVYPPVDLNGNIIAAQQFDKPGPNVPVLMVQSGIVNSGAQPYAVQNNGLAPSATHPETAYVFVPVAALVGLQAGAVFTDNPHFTGAANIAIQKNTQYQEFYATDVNWNTNQMTWLYNEDVALGAGGHNWFGRPAR